MASNKKGRQSSPPLPEDILFSEILPYMPAKFAARCRCVSRSWNHTLSSRSFIHLHLQRANSLQPKLFFPRPWSKPSEVDLYLHTWQPRDGPAIKKLPRPDLLNLILLTKTLHGLVLVCVQRPEDRRGYHVCNPCTGAVLRLPDTKQERKMNPQRGTAARPHPPCYQDVTYGLGYSSASNEYKVVRIFSDDEDTGAAPCCEVFVLGRPAYWRPTAQQPPPLCVLDDVESAVFLNGRLHFLCMDGSIITLDINDETFNSLSPPASRPPEDQYKNWIVMTELDGCLCVCHGGDMTTNLYRIWLLRGQEAQHWELICCFDPLAWSEPERMLLQPVSWIAPIGMLNADNGKKKIMFGTGTGKVLTIDPHVGTPEILCELDIGISNRSSAPVLFEESLVPVGRTIEEMVFSSPSTKAWSDVLKWLPARSVMELSLVCREWHALMTTDRFIRSHAIHANLIRRPPWLKFVMDRSFGSFIDVDGIGPMLPETTPGPFECSQPCHGLIVGNCNGSEFVCNPAIGYHAFLRDQEHPHLGCIPLGLGYNSDINDHVVVYLSRTKKKLEAGDYVMDCSMRHLQSRESEWINIDPPSRPVADIRPACVEGKIYCIVEPQPVLKSSAAACELVVCNIATGGKFNVLQGPPCKHDNARLSLLELHGAICVTCSNRDTNTIDVWMMRDNQAWSVEYRIELGSFLPEYTSDRTTLMGINPVDGRILLNTGRSLGHYDPKTVTLEIIYTLDRPQDDHKFCVIMCQESLLLPHPQPF